MISTTDLSVCFGNKTVVHNVNMQAHPGELTAIIGPNGSGKTSMMRAVCGEIPYHGRVCLNDNEVAKTQARILAAHRGVLPQFSSVTFPFTVGEIVRMGLANAVSVSNPENQIVSALEKVGLADYVGRRYHELSGGEQQRVQFARVLCQIWEPVFEGKPRWLFLDEPISSLDIQHQLTIMDISAEFARNGGGVISILHDLNLAAMYADRIIMMKDGRIVRNGSPQQVLEDEALADTFGCLLKVSRTPPDGQQFILPQSVLL